MKKGKKSNASRRGEKISSPKAQKRERSEHKDGPTARAGARGPESILFPRKDKGCIRGPDEENNKRLGKKDRGVDRSREIIGEMAMTSGNIGCAILKSPP